MTNRSIKLTALLLLIAAAAAWWWLRPRGVIDTPHGRVKLERSARVRNAWQQATYIMAGVMDWDDLTKEEQEDIERHVPRSYFS